MLQRLLVFFVLLYCPTLLYAASDEMYSINELLQEQQDPTPCAKSIYENALKNNAHLITDPETADSDDIDTWTRFSFSQKDTLTAVLECPEVKNTDPEDTIIFETVSYTFPNGRKIDINYKTQKKVLEQKLLLSNKRGLPGEMIAPDIASDAASGNIWVNVDPAWYAILVAEHGSLDEYIGPDKNNVVALRYIEDNIDALYPQNHAGPFRASCTSKTAIAGDTDIINRAATITVGGSTSGYTPVTEEEKEQEKQAKRNDYYVLGDGNLSWVMYAEIATDIILTVFTSGGYAVAKGGVVAARGTRAFVNAGKALKSLRTSKHVVKWLEASKNARTLEQAIIKIDKIEDSFSAINRFSHEASQTTKSLRNTLNTLKANKADAKTIKTIERELETATKYATESEKAAQTANKIKQSEQALKEAQTANPEKVKQLEKEIAELNKTYSKQLKEVKNLHSTELKALESADDVKTYKELSKARRETAHTLYLLRQGKRAMQANRGLLPVRAFKAAKSLRKGLKSSKSLNKNAKLIRANTSGLSTKLNDWLFHNTMRNIGAVAKVPASLSILNMAVKIAGDMYDKTDTSTTEYTNNIDLKPFLLLGADNLEGYENVVNYGMWMFWAGSSTSAADDDAAFLQAMDFAEKFHQDLVELQDEINIMACDVDIYIVRPIIRNPGTPDEELYYLFMNDSPWTTHGYNEPNDGGEQSSIPLRDSENIVPQPSALQPQQTTETTIPESDINQNIDYDTTGRILYKEPKYDGTKIGQKCTPPSKQTGVFKNDILTTGTYAAYPAFEKAMITKFRTEGGCVDHPADAGGYTCYGVSSKVFPEVRNPGFSRADAEKIAFERFFKKPHFDKLPDAISGDIFMAYWGTGKASKSVGLLQEILGVPKTNVVDDVTINAAINYTGDLRTQFLDAREKTFRSGQKEFKTGWLNALELYRANGCHTLTPQNIQ